MRQAGLPAAENKGTSEGDLRDSRIGSCVRLIVLGYAQAEIVSLMNEDLVKEELKR